jgi:hypothetical protein
MSRNYATRNWSLPEQGKQVSATAIGPATRTGAGSVAAGTLAPGLAGLHPAHQQVADQRGPADCRHECHHAARHRVLPQGRRNNLGISAPQSAGPLTFGHLQRQPPFIDHSSEIWNFSRDKNLKPFDTHEKDEAMKKTLMALGAAAALTISAVSIPAPALAQRGVAAGVAAGLLGGAIVGGAIASQNGYYYGPGYTPGYYGGGPAYVVDPGYGESCIWQRQRFWDGYGWRVRNVRVCD